MARFYDMPSAMGCSMEYKDFSTKAGFERNIFRCAMKLMTRVDVACWIGTRRAASGSSLVDVVMDLKYSAMPKRISVTSLSTITLWPWILSKKKGPRGHFLDHDHTFANFKENIFSNKSEKFFPLC